MEHLAHETLDVYKCAIQFIALCSEIARNLAPGNSAINDHLDRASFSIALNIAEGSGKPTRADAGRFYGIARGSAMECGAALDVLNVKRTIIPDLYDQGKQLLVRIVSMLTKMCR